MTERPRPPDSLGHGFAPAIELWHWATETVIAPGAELHNPDHGHLMDADVAFLWAGIEGKLRGTVINGLAQLGAPTGTPWSIGQRKQQLREWFGRVPDFLITLDAEHCASCSDAEFLALLEHELYHCDQAEDRHGSPRFDSDGYPVWCIRPHDVEEFVGVVERYGAHSEGLRRMESAFQMGPQVSRVKIAAACGTCLRVA